MSTIIINRSSMLLLTFIWQALQSVTSYCHCENIPVHLWLSQRQIRRRGISISSCWRGVKGADALAGVWGRDKAAPGSASSRFAVITPSLSANTGGLALWIQIDLIAVWTAWEKSVAVFPGAGQQEYTGADFHGTVAWLHHWNPAVLRTPVSLPAGKGHDVPNKPQPLVFVLWTELLTD